MKKKPTRTATAKRTNAASGKGRKVHALTGDRPDVPTSGTAHGTAQDTWTDAARKVATRIISLYYHCAEAVYHIGSNDPRFSFERMYAQELTNIRNEGIAETDIEQGGKLSVLAFKKIEAEREKQLSKWKTCIDELRTFQMLFQTLQAETSDKLKAVFTNEKIMDAPERILRIEEPKPLSPSWFMDKVYRDMMKNLKILLAMSFEDEIKTTALEQWKAEELKDERDNKDLLIVKEARKHGIEVVLSGASFENAKRFVNEIEDIRGNAWTHGLTGNSPDTDEKRVLSNIYELIDSGIAQAEHKYSDIAAQLPDEIDFQRAIERAGKEGTPTRAYAESAVSFLRNVSTLRGEELREHQRNRAAKIIKAKCLTIGDGARHYAPKLLEEAQRGGYGTETWAKTHKADTVTRAAIRALDVALHKRAEQLGLSEYVNKGKRGNRSRPSR